MERATLNRRSQQGFATVAAIAACAGLSLVAVALIDRAMSAESAARREFNRETASLALRSAVAQVSAHLANRAIAGFGSINVSIDGAGVQVAVGGEQAKVDILHADAEAIRLAISVIASANTADLSRAILAAREVEGASSLSLDELLQKVTTDNGLAFCLRNIFTTYVSSVDPRNNATAVLDGAILNLKATSNAIPDLTFERTLVITGNPTDPLLVLNERAFRTSQLEACSHEKQ